MPSQYITRQDSSGIVGAAASVSRNFYLNLGLIYLQPLIRTIKKERKKWKNDREIQRALVALFDSVSIRVVGIGEL
jgi:hypothetical protein